jgi:hypothetical protein
MSSLKNHPASYELIKPQTKIQPRRRHGSANLGVRAYVSLYYHTHQLDSTEANMAKQATNRNKYHADIIKGIGL